jgi:hypothetical protein
VGGGRNLAKFFTCKYEFCLYKGFLMKKMAQICKIFEGKNNSKFVKDVDDKFQYR